MILRHQIQTEHYTIIDFYWGGHEVLLNSKYKDDET